MNSNIYYFVLKVSIEGWPTARKPVPELLYSMHVIQTSHSRRINSANPH
jgi:hypothetical protein